RFCCATKLPAEDVSIFSPRRRLPVEAYATILVLTRFQLSLLQLLLFFVSKTAFAALLFFCAFGHGNRRSVAAFAADPPALFRFETLGQASRQNQSRDQALLRLAAGLKRCVSRIHLLRRDL